LNLPNELAALRSHGVGNGDTLLLKIDLLAAF